MTPGNLAEIAGTTEKITSFGGNAKNLLAEQEIKGAQQHYLK
jgi:hypothetical protein